MGAHSQPTHRRAPEPTTLGTMALVMGTASIPLAFVVLGALTGAGAVVAGHLAMSSGDHRSAVVAGLILGYVAMLVIPAIMILAVM